MKQSKYNFFYNLEDGNYLAFNALKNGLAVITEETLNEIESIKPGTTTIITNDKELFSELKRGGFICDDDFDEYGLLVIRRHMQQYATNALGLTIAPTLNCNLSCKYCYEIPQKTVMDDKVIKGLLKFVENYMDSGIRRLNIAWYGGEPLLCFNLIKELSKYIISLCKKNNVNYSASIVTNGTLFSREKVQELKKLNVQNAQITIDGYKEIHDKRRPFKSGEGSYDKIIANLKKSAGIIPVSLRLNIDVSNADKAIAFIQRLKKDKWFKESLNNRMIYVYYGHVKKYTPSCRCSKDEVLKSGDFWSKDLELKKYLYKNIEGFEYYPDISSGCTATTMHSYVIDPTGELYKCWNHLGIPGKSIGSIFEELELKALYISYLTESFEKDQECIKCRFLPICMGGCADVRVKAKTGEFDSKDCSQWKYYLEESLKLYYISKLESDKKLQPPGV